LPKQAEEVADSAEPERPVLVWLAEHGVALEPNGNGLHRNLVDLVRRRTSEAVIAAFGELYREDPAASARQLVFGAANSLDQLSRAKDLSAQERKEAKRVAEEAERARRDRGFARTQEYIKRQRSIGASS